MKLTILILTTVILQVSANSFAQKITLSEKNAPLTKIFEKIRTQTGYDFLVTRSMLKNAKPVSIEVKDEEFSEVLKKVFDGQSLTYAIKSNAIIVTKKTSLPASSATRVNITINVSGKVLDETEQTLPGATVKVKGSEQGTVTDSEGKFQLRNIDENAILIISFLGYIPQEVKASSKSEMVIKLVAAVSDLNEVVVVGYGTQKRSDLTGAVGTVNIAKSMPARPVTNVQELLAGAVPGLNVSKGSGAPGSGAGLNIRGTSTIGGSSGVLVIIDGFPGNIYTLNPTDIESVSVLKDAASAAIYGSRAANGVLLVTTKTGKKAGKPVVELNSSASFQQPQFQIDFVGSADYMNMWDQGLINDGKPALYGAQGQADLAAGKYADNRWYREIYKKSSMLTNQSLSVSGGSDAITYRMSGSYDYQDGTLPNNNFSKYIIRPDMKIKVSDKISIDAKLQYTQTDIKQPQGGLETWQVAAARVAPISPIYTKNGQYGIGSSLINNPVAAVNEAGYNKSSYTELFTILGLTYSPLKNWNIKGNFARYSQGQRTTDRMVSFDLYDDAGNIVKKQNLVPNITESYGSSWRNTLQVTSDYRYSFNNHNFEALVGSSQEYFKTENFNAFREGLPFGNIDVLNTGSATNQQSSGYATDVAIQSVFGRINYDYDGKYLLQANIRADGSSRFSQGNRWGQFPSFSAGWNIHRESFFNVPWISQLKLRGSWGILGDAEKVGAYATAQVLAYNPQIYGFNGTIVPGAYNDIAIDPNISWEQAKQTNIGVDIGLFNQKVNIGADYFYNKRENILTAPQVPAEFGLAGPVRNLFKMDNRGFEFLANYKDNTPDFNWGVNFNVSFSRNELKYIGEGVDFIISGNSYSKVGSQLDLPYGLTAVGLFRDAADVASINQGSNIFPGNIQFQDLDKNGVIDGQDRSVLNDKVPVRFGSNLNFGWKNFELSTNIYGSINNYRYISGYEGWAFFLSQNARPWALDSWTPDNPNASYPRLSIQYTSNDTRFSSFWLRKASYLKIQNAQIGYTIPQTMLDRAKIQSLRAYVSVQNLATISKYPGFDPEGGYYPISRTISVGVNLKF